MNNKIFNDLMNLFNKLTMPQKIFIGGSVVVTMVILVILMFFLNEAKYDTLFSNLANEDAAAIIDNLNSQKIPYKLAENGSAILVPEDVVYETRLSLSAKGLPGSGLIGYEIFDKNTLGMSEFLQKLNYKRALEGELSKTIMQQDGVEGVRVHIVIPKKSVFKEEEKLPTASILLKMTGNKRLSRENISSITHLVASSVEGLVPGNVTLLDSHGRLLSQESNDNPLAAVSSKHHEMIRSVEAYLADKAQSMLDDILGYGNSIVKVSAELNFDQVEKTITQYDPDSQVAISEQVQNTQHSDRTFADSTAQVTENRIYNYEINRSIERVVAGTGNINRLSVAAVINDQMVEVNKNGEIERIFQPRTSEQLEKLEQIVKNAVGINNSRDDQFSIVNIPFETNMFSDEDFETAGGTAIYEDYDKITNLVFVLIAFIASLVVIKKLMGRLKEEKLLIGAVQKNGQTRLAFQSPGQQGLPAGTQTAGALPQGGQVSGEQGARALPGSSVQASSAAPLPAPGNAAAPLKNEKKDNAIPDLVFEDDEEEDDIDLGSALTSDAAKKRQKHKKIAKYVAENPTETAKLIQSWLHEHDV